MEHENFSDKIENTSEIDHISSSSDEETDDDYEDYDKDDDKDYYSGQAPKGHILTLLHRPSPDYKCLVCRREFDSSSPPAVFRCKICEFSLHIRCALPPTIKSKFHRHTLNFTDSYPQDNSADYYCNACEKPKDPELPVYRCLECGSCFVSHFDCFFVENDLSIAHKLGKKASTVMIIHLALTVNEIMEFIAMYEAAELDAIARAARSEELAVGEVLRQDESGCSAQKVPIYSHEEFITFMEKYKSTARDTRSELKSPGISSQDANIGQIRLNFSRCPILSFFPKLFRYNSPISPIGRSHIFLALCMAAYNLCKTKDANISELDLFFPLWEYLRTYQLAESEIQFGFLDSDDAIEELGKYIRTFRRAVKLREYISRLRRAVQALRKKYSQCVVTNLERECLSETLEMVEEYMADNSWNVYTKKIAKPRKIYNIIDPDDGSTIELKENFSEESELEEEQTEESRLREGTPSGKDKIMFTWDFHILINKIEAFVVQHGFRRSMSFHAHNHRMTNYEEKNAGEVCCSGCKLPILENPIYGCRLCAFFLHRSCAELPLKIHCMLHDHDLLLRQFAQNVSEEAYCFVCKLALWGPTYKCTKCKFFVHKLCVQLPLEIQHPLHPIHTLVLDLDERVRTCNACGEDSRGCAFSCPRCRFCLEVRCIYLKPTIRSQSHLHLLTLIEEPSISPRRYCLACGENLPAHAPFLYCMHCNRKFHVECCFPSTNTCTTHRHPLTLTVSYLEDDDSEEFYCNNCEKERHPNHPIYLCKECNYVAHISCESY